MPLTLEQIERQVHDVAAALNVEMGEEGYFRGTEGNAAFMFKLTVMDPPAYLFKFRKVSKVASRPVKPLKPLRPTVTRPTPPEATVVPSTNWANQLPERYASANVNLDEGDTQYLYLGIRDASELLAEDIIELVRACAEEHKEVLPPCPSYCYECRSEVVSAWLVQSGTAITTICGRCLEAKSARVKTLEAAQTNRMDRLFLIPLALLLGTVGWALLWWGLDWVVAEAHLQTIVVPRFVAAVVVWAAGFGLGWPLGALLKSSGCFRNQSPKLIAGISAVVMALLGEVLHACWIQYEALATVTAEFVRENFIAIAFREDLFFPIAKIGLAVAIGLAVYQQLERKKNPLGL